MLVEAIGKCGLSDESACDYAGITPDTFYRWLKIDLDFSDTIVRARGEFKQFHAANIARQASSDWKASSWLLSHRFPSEYAERQNIVLEGKGSPLDRFLNTDDAPDAAPES